MGSPADAAPHVALLAFPFGTHAAPLLALARALAATAPAAAFSFLSTDRSLASLQLAPPNVRFIPISDGVEEGAAPPGNVGELIERFLGAAPASLRAGLEAAKERAGGARVSCVVSDAFLWFAREAAAEVGAPWVTLWTGGPRSLAAHLYTDLLRERIGVGDGASGGNEQLEFIPALSPARACDLPEGIVFGNIDAPISRLLHRMGKELPHAAAVALNSFASLDAATEADFKANFKHLLLIGPLNLLAPPPTVPDAAGCLSWLDRQPAGSVAYVSFGTVMSLPPPELAELAHGLEASGVPFLWSLKDSAREHLPAGFLDRTSTRGLVVPWAPQVEVLAHAAVGTFVTHCGWNSVMESMAAGVPMVCRPFFGDQRLNAWAVAQAWGVGVRLEGGGMSRNAVIDALHAVLKTEEGKKMKEKACELKAKAIQAVAAGGSSVADLKSLLEFISGC